jgi:hypothetical protein
MSFRLLGGVCAASILLSGCDGGSSSQPPADIAQACVGFGEVLFQTEEWLKPITHGADSVSWEKADDGDIIRVVSSNPLNGVTREVAILFAATSTPPLTAPYCQGYIVPTLGDVDGQQMSGLAVAVSQNGALMNSVARYRGQALTEPPVVEWPPAGATL